MAIPQEIATTIVDPKAYAHWERSHEAFKELRKSAPLDIAEPPGFDPFWVVTAVVRRWTNVGSPEELLHQF